MDKNQNGDDSSDTLKSLSGMLSGLERAKEELDKAGLWIGELVQIDPERSAQIKWQALPYEEVIAKLEQQGFKKKGTADIKGQDGDTFPCDVYECDLKGILLLILYLNSKKGIVETRSEWHFHRLQKFVQTFEAHLKKQREKAILCKDGVKGIPAKHELSDEKYLRFHLEYGPLISKLISIPPVLAMDSHHTRPKTATLSRDGIYAQSGLTADDLQVAAFFVTPVYIPNIQYANKQQSNLLLRLHKVLTQTYFTAHATERRGRPKGSTSSTLREEVRKVYKECVRGYRGLTIPMTPAERRQCVVNQLGVSIHTVKLYLRQSQKRKEKSP